MKISQSEIEAAWDEASACWPDDTKFHMKDCLLAALKVRKRRKASKMERQRKETQTALEYATSLAVSLHGKHYAEDAPNWEPLPDIWGVISQIDNMTAGLVRKEKDKQVVESVKAPCKAGEIIKIDFSDEDLRAAIINGLIEPTPSKAPEWDGTFGVGEWETRGGIMATVIKINANNKYPLSGNHGTSGLNCWWNDQGVSFLTKCRGFDLIRPWPKSEQ